MVIVTWAGPTAPSRQPDPPGSQSWGQAPRHRSEKRIRFGSLVGDLLGSQALRVVPAVVTDFGQSSERLTGSVLLSQPLPRVPVVSHCRLSPCACSPDGRR